MTKDIQLAKNFKLSEFGKVTDFNPISIELCRVLANELQCVRHILNESGLSNFKVDKTKDIGIKISSGLRTKSDYDRLVNNGYNPSKTSDHFFGANFCDKITLGAADVTFTNFNGDYEGIFYILRHIREIEFGQIILEYNPSNKNYWIHFGNSPHKVFSKEIADRISRIKYLISIDNGKTYKIPE